MKLNKLAQVGFLKNLSIMRKMILIFTIILIVGIGNIGIITYFQNLQKTDAGIVDVAGRQRMLSQKIGFYSQLAAKGNVDDLQILSDSIKLHDESLLALTNGGIAKLFELYES